MLNFDLFAILMGIFVLTGALLLCSFVLWEIYISKPERETRKLSA